MFAKRVVDILLSGAALIALMPLMLLVAAIIKITSSGPVTFRQWREGVNGTSFEILKFRSMRQDMCDLSGVAQTASNDPRVTAIGRFIRRTSIDELPQLINVLRGDMSLVGPRPHVDNMRAGGMAYKELVPYYHLRLQMQPGLTGWAQANGFRGSTTDPVRARQRIDHDIAYIQNFSIWLDLRIILITLVREFVGGSGE
ncbi:exopolysaccharide biosynthesis protein [Devosia chinhatensis]|uniref:Exopolysaccharide biosynthesis protein n=1 Tax=Devosia chinhatensis TaxID=429727 RepID=A0A0F5FN90_9HYPH|nr:exopolysaccharide biosynthesis protein [Devosia chinhatensis]